MNTNQFVLIPEHKPRFPSEIINLSNIDYIQIFSDSEIIINFASGKTKILKEERAKIILSNLTN